MIERAFVLAAAAAVGLAVVALLQVYRRRGRAYARLDVDALGLELMSGCCAFVVFTTPACAPCKAALNVVRAAAAKDPGRTEVTTVDALDRHDLAARYDVRAIPTTFLITASGRVVKRWKRVPEPSDVQAALVSL